MTLSRIVRDENSTEWLVGPNGDRIGTVGGCVAPLSFPGHIRPLSSVVRVMQLEEVKKTIAGRMRFRQRFPKIRAKNQESTNACNGYSAAGQIERARVRRGLPFVPIHGCSVWTQLNGGRNVGSHLAGAMEALMKAGASPEELCPKGPFLNFNQMSPEAKAAMARFLGVELYGLDTEGDLATALSLDWDVALAVQVSGGYNNLDSDGVVSPTSGPGNHAVLGDDIRYSDRLGRLVYGSMGSWGEGWGDDGYGWFTFDHFKQSIKVHRFYAIRSTIDDPQGDNPPVMR